MSDEAMATMAGLVQEDEETRWGEVAADWQMADAAAMLDVTGPRKHYLTRPRGGSKTSDVAGVAIAAIRTQLPKLGRGYAFAADRAQARLLLEAIEGFLARTSGLSELTMTANELRNLRTGAVLTVMSSDDASAWGLRPHLVICDEFAQWPSTQAARRLWTAIYSSIPKVPTARLVVMTSAGDPAHYSFRELERARSEPGWRVSEVPGPCPWIAVEELEEQRRALTDWQYARLHENRWTEGEGRLAAVADLRSCVTHQGPLAAVAGVRYVVGVDIGLRNDATVAAVCHLDEVGRGYVQGEEQSTTDRVVLDRMAVWRGSKSREVSLQEVEDWLFEAWASYRCRVVMDPWQSIGMAQRLRAKGVEVVEFTFSSATVGRLASTLHRLFRDRAMALIDDDELIEELSNVRLVETSPGVIRMDHDAGRHDDRAIALALAAQSLLARSHQEFRVIFDGYSDWRSGSAKEAWVEGLSPRLRAAYDEGVQERYGSRGSSRWPSR